MADANKKPGENGGFQLFGTPSSTAPTTNTGTSLFGATQTASSQTQSAQAPATTSLFGGATGTSSTSNTSGLFANLGQQTSNSSPFGSVPSTSSSPAFGTSKVQTSSGNDQQPAPSAGLFSGFATPAKPATASNNPAARSSTLFAASTGNPGNTNPSQAAPSSTPTQDKPSFSFGQPSTTPAGNPPGSNSLFQLGGKTNAMSTSSNNLFGSMKPAESTPAQPVSSATSLFGNLNKPVSATDSSKPSLFGNLGGNNTSSTSNTDQTQAQDVSQQSNAPKASLFGNLGPQSTSSNAPSGTATQSSFAPGGGQASTPAFSLGGVFGNNNPSSQGSQPAATNSKGDATSLFGNNSAKIASAPTTSASGLFGALNKDGNQSATQPSTSGAGLFGNLNTNSQSTNSSTVQTPNSNTAKPSPFSLGGPPLSSEPSKAPMGSIAPPSQVSDPAAGLQASSAAQAAATTQSQQQQQQQQGSTTTASSGEASKPTINAPGAGATAADLNASTSGPAPSTQSRLKNRSMDEIVTRWATDLGKYQREFQTQAERVMSWDRMLLDNGNAISKLYAKTYQAERDTAEVEKQLSTVEGNQDELAHWLDRYEREVDELMAKQLGQGEALQGPDQERERTFKTAEKVSERLSEMGTDLTNMIVEINDASNAISKTSKPDDPLTQIVRVLNGHLTQLQAIDQGTAALQVKVDQSRKEGQKLTSGMRGNNGDAVEDFYKSFMRRS